MVSKTTSLLLGCVLLTLFNVLLLLLQMGDLTLLPDGTAFLTNGAQIGKAMFS